MTLNFTKIRGSPFPIAAYAFLLWMLGRTLDTACSKLNSPSLPQFVVSFSVNDTSNHPFSHTGNPGVPGCFLPFAPTSTPVIDTPHRVVCGNKLTVYEKEQL